ncbi:helix-turn-helix domain-containing protein [Fictibacillus sp. NRS-1165]|uniref:helix-turn-helix domain-containing protein n=1 Tax=Fictibacillus sp. NRS-1165 TaxID=3144463 RepID=UPI003D214FC3
MDHKIGAYIQKLRRQRGISLCKLAVHAGISKSYLSAIENLKTNPSIQVVQKIASALEVPVENIVNREAEIVTLDEEWVELVLHAKDIGLKKEEIHAFFDYEMWKQHQREGTIY